MNNNLFQFATSELSQDAFICWCLNWFNDDRKPRLREMAISLIKRMAGDIDVQSVEIIRQYSDKAVFGDGKELAVKTDVFAIINHSIGLIIEDKTFTGIHDNQIYRYVDGIKQIITTSKNGRLNYKEKSYSVDPSMLRTVFWKTGFHYDYDKAVTADVKLDGQEVQTLLSPYHGESEILNDYLDNLQFNLDWYEQYGDFTKPHILESGEKEYDWWCNLAEEYYPQHRLMRTLFPEERWIMVPDGKWEPYQVYHGSSFGRPWTEANIFHSFYPDTTDKWEVFWRIDTDNDGPYISLRFYEGGLKKETKARHVQKYDECVEKMKNVLNEISTPISLSWRDVYPGYRGNYKEASFFHVSLSDYLRDWESKGEALIQTIRTINDAFVQKMTLD